MTDASDPIDQSTTGQSTAPNPVGRPTKYRAVFAKQAAKLSELGATDAELAEFFEIDLRTLYRWKVEHEKFRHAIKPAKDIADERVERSLYQMAMGNADLPPNVAAAIFWLKNRQPGRWRDRQDLKVDGSMTLVQIAGDDANV